MLHVVTAINRYLYEEQLSEFHRHRYDIYIVERGWRDGLRTVENREYDQFDDDQATYMLAIEDESVVGGSRLLPTSRPHMLETVCPQLADVRGIPRGPDIYEWTRLFTIKSRREGRYGGAVLGELFTGTVEYCHSVGIRQISFVFEARWLPRLTEMGWRIKPLGLPDFIAGDWWMAATFEINAALIAMLRRYHRQDGPVLANFRHSSSLLQAS